MNVIYKITCVKNGKFYIGSTVNKSQRWARHRKDLRSGVHKNTNMQASWNKHGEEAFTFEVLETVVDAAQLMVIEQRHLDQCVGLPNCFNHNKFADSPWRGKYGEGTPNFGRPVPPAVRAKISASLRGDKNPSWGKAVPAERRAKISAANKAYPHHEYRHTDDAKKRIGASSKARPQSLATRAKRSASMKGHEVSTLTRMKISQTLSGEGNYWYGKQRPESFKEKIRKAVVATAPDGIQTMYESIQALREHLDLSPSTVNRALKSEKQLTRGPYKGWQFRYGMQ